jgi:hypothetical protein
MKTILLILFLPTIAFASEHLQIISPYKPSPQLEEKWENDFIMVCNILDYSPKEIQIKIYYAKNSSELTKIIADKKGCFIPFEDIIFISENKIDRYVICHELAHAILSIRTSGSLNKKLHELIAQYVEFEIMKEEKRSKYETH